jgi:hypothetical protein
MTWETTEENEVITIPVPASTAYNFQIDWGDCKTLDSETYNPFVLPSSQAKPTDISPNRGNQANGQFGVFSDGGQ